MKYIQSFFIICSIALLGAFFRLYNVDWDSGNHLHPDERFLTMVNLKQSLPHSFTQYLNPITSPLSPSVAGFTFFVYGTFPLSLIFLISTLLHTQTYELFTLEGRVISALFDVFTLLLVYRIIVLLQQQYALPKITRYVAPFFYAVSVLPIQLSHFYTVDIFLSFFIVLAIYFSLQYFLSRQIAYAILGGVAFGCAIACKVSGLGTLPLLIVLLLLPTLFPKRVYARSTVVFSVFVISAYIALRLTNPYFFASASFFDLRIHPVFIQSAKTLAYYANPTVWYPPNVQWITKIPVIFSLTNIVFFGLGLGLFLFCLFGMGIVIRKKWLLPNILLAWVVLFFFYQSFQYVQTMRYFIFLYPFFAIFSGIGFVFFMERKPRILSTTALIIILFWPVAFMSIYTKLHTRIAASIWIYQHIPAGKTILGEYWDDLLPLDVPPYQQKYNIIPMHVFDTDSPEKMNMISNELKSADYLVFASNRGYGSIQSAPKTYPLMSRWYANFLAGKLSYKKVAEFDSFPSLSYLGIPLTIPDTSAEEAFTVYDHPVVLVYQHIRK